MLRPAAEDRATDDENPLEFIGQTHGAYRLVDKLGEGGFGVVYRAAQNEPIGREVAFKIVKAGMDSAAVLRRFEAERQALERMDHPGIAKVLDAGATESGRPYFVMELVDGAPVTEFCEAKQLDTRERLDLFAQVCRAVAHAHQKGIIHRDLKPSNVLVCEVDGEPVPKVIDFGIAKATRDQDLEATMFTLDGQIVGTPTYMSPEQAATGNADIDTRSDIYSLGVLLYELLTGRPPFDADDLAKAGHAEMCRIIREEDPARPSAQLTSDKIATRSLRTSATPDSQRSRLGGDEGARKGARPTLRDRQRLRARRPPLPCQQTGRRRRRPDLATGSRASPGATVGSSSRARRWRSRWSPGTVVSTWQAIQAHEARDREADKAQESQDVLNFFLESVIASARPENLRGGLGIDTTIHEALDAAEPQIAGRFAGRPLVEASIRHAFGVTYLDIGEIDDAVRQLQRAIDLRTAAGEGASAETLLSMSALAEAFSKEDRREETLQLIKKVHSVRLRELGVDHADTIGAKSKLATVYAATGRGR